MSVGTSGRYSCLVRSATAKILRSAALLAESERLLNPATVSPALTILSASTPPEAGM